MGRQKPGQALARRTGVAEQDRVVEGYGSPLVKNPLTTESRMTPLSTVSEKPPECTAVPVPCSTSVGIPMSGLPRAVPGSCLSLLGAPGMEWSDQATVH